MLNSKSDELSLLTSNNSNSRSNKENIFTRLNSQNVFTYNHITTSTSTNSTTTDKEDSIVKMPPVTTKLPGRQTNNSLSSMTGNILIETPPPITQPPITVPSVAPATTSRKKKAKPES